MTEWLNLTETLSKRNKERLISTFGTLAPMADTPRKILLMQQLEESLIFFFYKIVKWTLTMGNCCREKSVLSPCWNCFFDLLFVAVVTVIIHIDLPQRTLTLCLTVKLKCLCYTQKEIIWPCPPVKTTKTEKRLTQPFQRLTLPGNSFQDWRSFHVSSPLSFFLYSAFWLQILVASLWLYKRTWHSDLNKMVTLRLVVSRTNLDLVTCW